MDDNTPVPTDPVREALETQKLELEIRHLKAPWFRQPQTWINSGTLLIALLGAYITIRFQAHQSDLKIAKADIETQRANFAVDVAKQAQVKAEGERDKALRDADEAETRAKSARAIEAKTTVRVERVKALMSDLTNLRLKERGGPIPDEAWTLLQKMGDAMFGLSIIPVSKVARTDDGIPYRTIEIKTDPPGLDVYVITGSPDWETKTTTYVSSNAIAGLHNNRNIPPSGQSPLRMKVPVGLNFVAIWNEKSSNHETTFTVPLDGEDEIVKR